MNRLAKVKPVTRKIYSGEEVILTEIKASCSIVTQKSIQNFSIKCSIDDMWHYLRDSEMDRPIREKSMPSKMPSA